MQPVTFVTCDIMYKSYRGQQVVVDATAEVEMVVFMRLRVWQVVCLVTVVSNGIINFTF